MRQALVVAPLHPAQVHHAIHHRDLDILALAGAIALMQRRQQADGQMQAGAGVANLRAGDERRALRRAGCAHCAAHRLGDVFIGLEIRIRPGRTESLDRTHHDARIDFVNLLPCEAETVEHARTKVFHDDVALLDQFLKDLFALGILHVHRDRALVAVQHGEVQAVGIRHIAQLPARRITLRRLELDHVRAHPGQQLRTGRPRLHMGHVEDAHVFQCFHSGLQVFRGGWVVARRRPTV
jgi:hypothetical protein